jgi:hypothetical protein
MWDRLWSCACLMYHGSWRRIARIGNRSRRVPVIRKDVPQKPWSPKNGTTMVGAAFLRPIAVVPAPPWCTTALTRSNNQSCGTLSRMWTWAGTVVEPKPPQPTESRVRMGVGCVTARRIVSFVEDVRPCSGKASWKMPADHSFSWSRQPRPTRILLCRGVR